MEQGNRTLVGTASIINGEAYANIELLNTPYSYEVIYQGVRYADTDTYSKCHIETQTTRLYIFRCYKWSIGSSICCKE